MSVDLKERAIALPQLMLGAAWGYGPSRFCEGCGQCCEAIPGPYYPHDIKELTVETILKGLHARIWIIDDWMQDIDIYFLRPRTKTDPDQPYYGSWGGECANLSDAGCSLEWHDRPSGCRALRPKEHQLGGCEYDDESKIGGKESAARAWSAPGIKGILSAALCLAQDQWKEIERIEECQQNQIS